MRKPAMTLEQQRRRAKELTLLHTRHPGYTATVPNGPMVEHAKYLNQYLTFEEIGERAGVPGCSIGSHVWRTGEGHTQVSREMAEAVLAVRLRPEDKITSEDRARGARRIALGLVAKGWTYAALAGHLPITPMSLANLVCQGARKPNGYHTMSKSVYAHFLTMADKLETADPIDHGVNPWGRNLNLTRERNRHTPPLGAWDLDTIHRADVFPDWTGECGTIQGYYLHLQHSLAVEEHQGPTGKPRRRVMCEPCTKGRVRTRAERDKRIRNVSIEDIRAVRQSHPSYTITQIAAELGIAPRTVQRKEKEACRTDG